MSVVIPLTKGYETTVDDDVASLITWFGWTFRAQVNHTGKVYAALIGSINGRALLLHRWIKSAPPNLDVDHRDGYTLNNQDYNLRLATTSQNLANSVTCCGVTGFRGVFPHGNGFRARTSLNGKVIRLGTYPTPEIASAVYEAKRIEIFGEFAPTDRIL